MMRRVKRMLLPLVATLMVIAGMTAGVTASSGLTFPSWGAEEGSELIAGPLGLNPSTGGATIPMAIQIPDASVDAEVEQNQIVDGVMLDPSGPWVVSWYQETAMLGEVDNVVMSGHIDYWDVGPAVFYTVAQLGDNAPIYVTGKNGVRYTYAVEWVKNYEVAGLTRETINEIVGPTDYRALTLITCGGEFNGSEYLSRTIIRAKLIKTEQPAGGATTDAAATNAGDTATAAQDQAGDEQVDELPASLAVGSTASVTQDGLNLRASATTGSDIVTTLAAGQVLTIIGGPQDADGYTWWQVQLDDGTQGWVAGDFLQVG